MSFTNFLLKVSTYVLTQDHALIGGCIVYVVDFMELNAIVQTQHIDNRKYNSYTINYECRGLMQTIVLMYNTEM
jgi:hypothetical protein